MTEPAEQQSASPSGAARDAYFLGPRRPIAVRGAGPLLPILLPLLPGWPIAPPAGAAPNSAGGLPDILVEPRGSGLRISEGAPIRQLRDYDDIDEGINGLIGALIAAYVAQAPELVSLHAAAAELDRGLAVMIGDAEAGKSSLAAHLVRLGFRSFGDDRLVLRLAASGRDEGLCLALPHKLRLPLPGDAGAAFAAFVDARAAWRGAHVVQLRLAAGEEARFGEASPVAALVLLERGGAATATLEPAPPSLVVRALLRQGFAPQLSADALLHAFVGLSARVPGFRLRYRRSDQAARLLAHHLSRRGASASARGKPATGRKAP